VTGGTDEFWQAIERADGMPHGRARIALLEELVARTEDTTPDPGRPEWDADTRAELGTAARVSLIPACLYGGEHQRVPALLGRLLERYDEAPAWFGPWERHSVLFCFSWATVGLLQHPDVPLAELRRLLTEMARRYTAAEESMAPVRRAEFLFHLHVDGAEAATDAFEAWLAAGRSELSECEECERAEQVRQFAALGRHQEAVDLALPVLDGAPVAGCAAQPIALIAAVLGSLLETGQGERAAAEHVRAVRLIRDLRPNLGPGQLGRSDHLLICARSGRLQRGLDLLEEWLPWYARVGPPTSRLETAAAAGRMLRGLAEAGHGQLVLTADQTGADPTTVDELGARLAHEARDLGSRFDARNGTSTVGDLVERVLDATPLPDLPLDALTRSTRQARVRPAPARSRRGRRAAGRDVAPALPTADPVALAAAFDQALAADAHERCDTVLAAWRELRQKIPAAESSTAAVEQAAARLDSWLALAELSRPGLVGATAQQAALTTAMQATERLQAAGLSVQAQLHEQATLLTAAQLGRIGVGIALQRIEQLALELELGADTSGATRADVGLALSRLVLVRELAAMHGHDHGRSAGPDGSAQPSAARTEDDPLDAGLAALESVPPGRLEHQHLRAVSRLLRVRARDEPVDQALKTLRAAVEVLPDGVRPLERAQAGADLAGLLQEVAPAEALPSWDQAIADAGAVPAAPTLGNLLAARANLQAALGRTTAAAEDLTRAIPLLNRHVPGPLAAQARLDLSQVLLDLERPFEAAEVAEAGLEDLSDLLRTQNVESEDLDGGSVTDFGGHGEGRPELHVAGCLAFSAAEANAATGAEDRARELAGRSADWHRLNHNPIAQAEAWELKALLGDSPAAVAAAYDRAAQLAEGAGDWVRAATCRRERIIALKESEGLETALTALSEAEAALEARRDNPAGRHASPQEQLVAERQLRWHRLAVAEQRARLLAVSGRFPEAMAAVDGLDTQYQELGDAWSARDLIGLRGQLRAELHDLDGALDDLRRAAEEAEQAGDPAQAHGLGERLAAVLDEAGRPVEAEAAWNRFCAA
jgi:tetratricopeptide (TPR) repeat protein